ncbi:hypothetical protein FAIPA1_270015 [Frankia sp. AiPs1]
MERGRPRGARASSECRGGNTSSRAWKGREGPFSYHAVIYSVAPMRVSLGLVYCEKGKCTLRSRDRSGRWCRG